MDVRRASVGGIALLIAGSLGSIPARSSPSRSGPIANPRAEFAQLPLWFEENRGQVADPDARFLTRADGYTAYFTPGEVVFSLPPPSPPIGPRSSTAAALRMRLEGDSVVEPAGDDRRSGTANYLLGDDPSGWQQGVPTYGAVVYEDVAPGIDLRYRSSAERLLEYDVLLAPGARAADVAIRFDGATALRLGPAGDLVVETVAGDLVQRAPTIYQPSPSGRLPVDGRFVLRNGTVGFVLGPHDPSLPVVIDPAVDLEYSTVLGNGHFERAWDVAVDGGAAYLTGETEDVEPLPTTTGAYDETANGGGSEAFVAKIVPDAAGSADLVYSTLLGGTDGVGGDFGYGIAVSAGAAYVTGQTGTIDFPTTTGAFDETDNLARDGFFSVISADGSALSYSTYLGGSCDCEALRAIAVEAGVAYITGESGSSDFPTTAGAFRTGVQAGTDTVFVKVDPGGNGAADLLYGSYIGGSVDDGGTGIDVLAGDAYITGYAGDHTSGTPYQTTADAFDQTQNGSNDAVLSVVDPTGGGASDYLYGTFLGGAGSDVGRAIEVGGGGVGLATAYITGDTGDGGPALPTTPGAFDTTHNGASDAFYAEIDPASAGATDLQYATFLGGAGNEIGLGVDHASGSAYVAGNAEAGFPTTFGAFDTSHNGGQDVFFSKITTDFAGTDDLDYSTFLGGSGADMAGGLEVAGGKAYLAGRTEDDTSDLPTTPGAYDTTHNGSADVFLSVIPIDTSPPTTDIDTGPDGPTNDPTPTFTFHSNEQGVTFDCRVDAAPFTPCSGPGDAHTTAALTDGPHTFHVRATDAWENADTSPPSRAFSVDTTPPETIIETGPSGLTNASTATFRFTSDPAGATFQCRLDGPGFGGCSGPGNSHTVTVADGPHTFEVRALDELGNADTTPPTRAFTVDTTPPDTTLRGKKKTHDRTPKLRFGSTEEESEFLCRLDRKRWKPCESPFITRRLSFGWHRFLAMATDAAGNVEEKPARRRFKVLA